MTKADSVLCRKMAMGKKSFFRFPEKDELIQVKIKPEPDENNVYKMGAWLRDSAQGIGTMTYIDNQNRFGALGHGINDMDTGELLKLGSGLLYHTEIVAVKRGERGNPGELTGVIEYKPDQVSGVIVDNTVQGFMAWQMQRCSMNIRSPVPRCPLH